jgi:hypothetical protein
MSRRNPPLEATIAAFRAAGLEPEVERTRRHVKVRCAGFLTIVVASSPSDYRAAVQARALARRAIRRGRK